MYINPMYVTSVSEHLTATTRLPCADISLVHGGRLVDNKDMDAAKRIEAAMTTLEPHPYCQPLMEPE